VLVTGDVLLLNGLIHHFHVFKFEVFFWCILGYERNCWTTSICASRDPPLAGRTVPENHEWSGESSEVTFKWKLILYPMIMLNQLVLSYKLCYDYQFIS